ncbi:ROK family transcriptional regulator [Pseudarthrobacter sulfonivorans]|uniref:ROK family transcriptional regulator n=1 Tax=Pseudarthrobacter sulfonivorans TaxID=121292 RepID=UPI00285BEA9C|nr:ROK family transcriptional regulator [Pseudarthrobacter sulfonivorans]MDR6414767.1 putative NBD/HSP70 family sugar kinase [Pseudarthrobacter sulfonivorans]
MPADGGPGRVQDVRRQNLAVVLDSIQRTPRTTRAEIAASTGLTKASVSSLVTVLLDTGLVEEAGVARDGERGRPGSGLVLNRQRGALGAEINVDYLAVGVVDALGELRGHKVLERRPGGLDVVFGDLQELARAVAGEAKAAGIELLGGGLAVPGLVDPTRKLVLTAPNLGWQDAALERHLEALLPDSPLGVVLSNEANSAALAELWYGHGSSFGDYLYVSGEVGVGGGLIFESQLFAGPRGHAGEIGHVVVQPDGLKCGCGGRGCLETVAGQDAVFSAAGIQGATTADRMAALMHALRTGAPDAVRAVERAGHFLGIALVSAARMVNVSAVILGGHFAGLQNWIRPSLRQSLETYAPGLVPPDGVAFSELGQTAALRGAAGSRLREAFASPADLLN